MVIYGVIVSIQKKHFLVLSNIILYMKLVTDYTKTNVTNEIL